MATMRLKNKYEVSFIKMIKEAKKDKGIPDEIAINGHEAWDVLNEIRALKHDCYIVGSTSEYDPRFELKDSGKLERKDAQALVTKWYQGKFDICFKYEGAEIPLVVEPKNREKKNHAERARSESKDQGD